ncbi:MAG: hypothetical protein LBC27_03915 [Spirochaetaceae bacterium]|nr:hypothetical protein [Spirochaetaceae bacterium]
MGITEVKAPIIGNDKIENSAAYITEVNAPFVVKGKAGNPLAGLAGVVAVVLLVMTAFPAAAQESDDEIENIEAIEAVEDSEEDEDEDTNAELPITSNWDGLPLSNYTRGDQTFNISLGILLPLFFTSNSGKTLENKIALGGTGSLAYTYYLNSRFFLGGVLSGSFSQTLGKNFLYLIPIGFTAGYQITMGRFEFPFSLTIGGMTEQYLTYNGYWLFIKPQASGFFRFNSDWSFGLNAAWWVAPQWTNTPEKDAVGNFMEITLSARYHF